MKKLKICFGILIALVALTSCSNNDDPNGINDIIIGKWKKIERYESNQLVEFQNCENLFDKEYKADNTYFSYLVIPGSFPGDCNIEYVDTGLTWTNLGDSNYRFKSINGEIEIFIKIYKQGETLVHEYSDGIVREVFENI